MNLRKFTILFLSMFFSAIIFASDRALYVLNPDPYSQALGASILSLSPSVFGFFTNPASNYKNFSKEIQFSYMSYYDQNYGGNIGFILPTEKYGNFSIIVSGVEYNKEIMPYKNSFMAAINYVYPITKKYPVYIEKGAIGATVKFYNVSATIDDTDKTSMLFSADLGFIYSLDFIDDDLIGALAFKNFGNDLDFDFLTENDKKQTQIFSASARYLISEIYKVSLMADMVKHFQSMDLGYACGLETVPFYPLSLRVGWRDYRDNFNKGITAGFSLNFDKVNIAYSFSDILNSDDDQHIFSLGIAFGKIDDLGKAYEHYLGYYLNKAKDEYKHKNYISARKQFEDILSVYPDDPVAKHYIQMLSEDLEQSDVDLDNKIERYLTRADSALLKNNLIKAKSYYEKVLQLKSSNETAKKGIAVINSKLSEQEIYANRKKHQKEITQHWLKAMNFYDDGEFVFAKEELNKIIEIDPTNAGAKQYLSIIQKKVDKINNINSHDIFKQGLVEYEKHNYEKALAYFNTAYISSPSRTDIKEYIDKCNKQINLSKEKTLSKYNSSALTNKQIEEQMRKVYDSGIEQYTLRDFDGAINTFTKLNIMAEKNRYYSYNEQIKSYISKSKNALSKQLYNEGVQLESREDLVQAYEKYKKAFDYDNKNISAKKSMEKINDVLAQKYYDQAIEAFSKGDKTSATKLLKKSLEYSPNKLEAQKFLKRINK